VSFSLATVNIPQIGMAIPARFSFHGDSRNRGMAVLYSPGIEEDKIHSSGSWGNFEEFIWA
jgi:hypothetical protein